MHRERNVPGMSAANAPAMRPAQRAGRQWRELASPRALPGPDACNFRADRFAGAAGTSYAVLSVRGQRDDVQRVAHSRRRPRARMAAVRRLASGRQQP